jgi:Rab GDP dissociation inhibitor
LQAGGEGLCAVCAVMACGLPRRRSPCACVQLWEKFRPGQPVPKELGPHREYNIDLVPKFMMANGLLVKVLLHTDVVKYLEFKAVDGSFVLNKGKIHKAGA